MTVGSHLRAGESAADESVLASPPLSFAHSPIAQTVILMLGQIQHKAVHAKLLDLAALSEPEGQADMTASRG